MFTLLHDHRYRLLWLASSAANIARWMDTAALGWLVIELTNRPQLLGLAVVARFAPTMVFGIFAGALADRFHPGKIFSAIQSANLASALALALLFGTAWAVDGPVKRVVLYAFAGPQRVTSAVSLESLSMLGSKMVGPLVAGVLLSRGGAAGYYTVLAGVYVVGLLLTVRLYPHVSPVSPKMEWQSLAGSIVAGLRDAWRHPTIRTLLLITLVFNALVMPYQQMLPVLARNVLGLGPEQFGLLFTLDGLGALVAAVVIGSRRTSVPYRRWFAMAATFTAAFVVALALSRRFALALLIQFMLGTVESTFGMMQGSILLLTAPAGARGRMQGILSTCIGTMPLGALALGFTIGQFGVAAAIAGHAALGLLLMLPLAVERRAQVSRTPAEGRQA
ncbi:MAG: MFS transporter [Armatimonadetes bacterium]|nr:MFS transporter [Armatimonadota bacterium]